MGVASKAKVWISSAEIIGSNLDLLNKILFHLPAKPLLRFKCVSKQWLSMISDTEFCFSHARFQRMLNPTPTALLLNYACLPTPGFQIVPLKDKRDAAPVKVPFLDYLNLGLVKLLHSCNGLLLCTSNVDDFWDHPIISGEDNGKKYFICNPTTKQFQTLEFPFHVEKDLFLYLAFDPLTSPHYKVLCLRAVNPLWCMYQILVYSSESNSWKQLQSTFRFPFSMDRAAGIFCNGSVHWCHHYYQESIMLYFDLDSESLKMTPVPTNFSGKSSVLYFGESQGQLHMVLDRGLPALEFDIFELALDYSGWSMKHHVVLHSVTRMAFSVFNLIKAEKEGQSLVVIFVLGKVICYNLSNGTSSEVCDLWPTPFSNPIRYRWHDAFEYLESLVRI